MKTPTFTISPDRQPCRNPVHQRQRGFTLIELLVVLAIGSMLVGLVPPAFDRLRDVSQYRDTVRAMVVDLKQARQQSLAYGQVVVFSINLADRQFGIVGTPFKTIPTSLEIKTTTSTNGGQDSHQQATFSFLPDGGSSGGNIELIRKSGAGVRLKVDWLFGQVTQEPRSTP